MDGLVRKCDCRLRRVKYGLSKTIIKKKECQLRRIVIFIIPSLCSFYYVSPYFRIHVIFEVLRYMRFFYYLNIIVWNCVRGVFNLKFKSLIIYVLFQIGTLRVWILATCRCTKSSTNIPVRGNNQFTGNNVIRVNFF